jgi:hypothetical protein
MLQDKTPEGFPGPLMADLKTANKNEILHKAYRVFDGEESFELFLYFVTKVLEKLNPTASKRCGKGLSQALISSIYTASDEAFGLYIIHNELECWKIQCVQMKEGKRGADLRVKKRYTDFSSGRRNGTDPRCERAFKYILKMVKKRRETSREMEERFKEWYTKEKLDDREVVNRGDEDTDFPNYSSDSDDSEADEERRALYADGGEDLDDGLKDL